MFSLMLDGREAKLVQSRKRPGRYELSVDGIPQSVVSMTDPTALDYAYIRHIARAIDAAAEPGAPLFTVHLGAGALTLARYVEATRTGSPQLVVEFEPALYEAVIAALPLPATADLRVIFGDARAVADAELPDGSLSSMPASPTPTLGAAAVGRTAVDTEWVDARFTVVDLWDAAVIRHRVASQEFYRRVAARAAADGVVAVNLLDGHPFEYSRRQAATLNSVFTHVAVVLDAEPDDDEGPLGNVVIFASDDPLDVVTTPDLLGTPRPHMLHADGLTSWFAGARIMTDADGTDSPDPDDPLWD
ncbi:MULTISPECIES: spermine synthase [unclassified Microbacterium]|uniref:spermine synthase n=1 Tax=unclassified Microbacterium TaxID=2609290 RepID=UPI0016053C31|nr:MULTISPECIES: spermine synthase [unclassified Microbacterium]QNA93122.1 spermine synthase [Microbacterium sp. Se63.02b]QYM63306.1 spermine synthase [Microbacterium sp. Se5.02b]